MAADALFQASLATIGNGNPWGRFAIRGGGNIQTGPFGSQLHASDYVAVGVPSIMPQNISHDRVDYGRHCSYHLTVRCRETLSLSREAR